MSSLKYKNIVLGVSGGISAYKAVELLRLLTGEGASVQVVMTDNAKQFVTPLTFQALSGKPVYHSVFGSAAAGDMEHIRSAEKADLLVIAPATANIVAKMAAGLAEDALSTLCLAFAGPVMVAPAMNEKMFSHPAVRENLQKLASRGVCVVEPEHGELACGGVGQGRLPEPQRLLEEIKKILLGEEDLAGWNILVSAGPTREPIDPVRFISNPSSGKMGYAIAGRARARGAEVTLVSGPTHLPKPAGVRFFSCQQAEEMAARIRDCFPHCDALVMTAAVGDFAPVQVAKEKIKKAGKKPLILKLHPTHDILREMGESKTRQLVVGFAAESENVIESALEKLRTKHLDMILANDISAPGIGFQSDANQVSLIRKGGAIETLPRLPKTEIAGILLDRLREMKERTSPPDPED